MPPIAPIVNGAATALLLSLMHLQQTSAFKSQTNLAHGLVDVNIITETSSLRAVCSVRRGANGRRRRKAVGHLHAAPDENSDDVRKPPPVTVLDRPWDVEVLLHGERRIITVQPGDSILEAAEMSGMNVSYECRRGNCISCAARVQEGSSGQFENRADRRGDDGAPEGFVLTCSTYPVGPGVKLELSANAEMWTAFCRKFDDASTKGLLRQASASVMTDYNVRHPEEFRKVVERQFKSQ